MYFNGGVICNFVYRIKSMRAILMRRVISSMLFLKILFILYESETDIILILKALV